MSDFNSVFGRAYAGNLTPTLRTRRHVDTLIAAAEQIRHELQEALARRDELAKKYGREDQFKEGDVITFTYRFHRLDGSTSQKRYKYAAIFINGAWYTTGPAASRRNPMTWDELVDWWERGKVTNLKVVTARRRIV